MDGLDYEICAQLLARLDAEGEDTLVGSLSTTSLSPVDRNSTSPPGLCSATSLSPESLKLFYEDNLNPWEEQPVFYESAPNNFFLNQSTWDNTFMSTSNQQSQPQPQPQPQQQQDIAPIQRDYIKIEEPGSQEFFVGQTLSPKASLIDPSAPTALEGTNRLYPYGSSNGEPIFNYSYGQGQRQAQQNNNSDSAWNPQPFIREDFNPPNWEPPQQVQQVQQQQQQVQLYQQQQQQQQQRQKQQQQQHHHHQQQQERHMQVDPPARDGSVYNSQSPRSPTSSFSPESARQESPMDDSQQRINKKRKTSGSPEDDTRMSSENTNGVAVTGRKQQPKKTAHNMIEKRYRTNLNDKIAALRDSVPSLRVMAGTSKLGDDDEEEDLEGLTPAHKLNKATVLAKATEYIRHLEKRSKKLQEENDHLKNRLSTFEKLATMGGAMTGQAASNGRNVTSGPGGGLMSRLMVGSLAGLMVANGLTEQETGRGLFGFILPFELGSLTPSPVGGDIVLLVFKLLLLFTAIAYVLSPGFFDSTKKPKATSPQPTLKAAPSLASPVEVRNKAWLTAIQTVWVPRNSIVVELAALGLKFMKLSVRQLVGWNGYALLTGTTEEYEIARVKAWTIALDAQLAGGDPDINRQRLLLTLLASMTLPATPSRLMLNALHIRILLWDLHLGIAEKLSTYYWNQARQLHLADAGNSSTEPLPEHLAALLKLDACDVLHDTIVRRAYNLAYNRPSDYGLSDDAEYRDEGMNSVVKDFAIRAPLDALAAWYSSLLLRRSMIASLKAKSVGKGLQEVLAVSSAVAPPTSGAQLRVLVVRSVLLWDRDGKDLAILFKAFKDDFAAAECQRGRTDGGHMWRPRLVAITSDIKIAVRCAMALALIKQETEKGRKEGIRLFSDLDWSFGQETLPNSPDSSRKNYKTSFAFNHLGLMGFVVSWKTFSVIAGDEGLLAEAKCPLDNAAGTLRRWIGASVAEQAGIGKGVRKQLGEYCTNLLKKRAGFDVSEEDAGYVSGEKDNIALAPFVS